MPKRIESLTLEHFKGATCTTTIDFDTNKPVVMIFGENGTGKSTIVDAIDFVCNEEFGSINDRSVSSSKADLVASFGKEANDLKITLKYGENTWNGTIGHGRKPSSTGSGQKPKVKILRRSQILKIVNSIPSDRYKELKTFIAVPNVEKNETTLRDAVKYTHESFNEASRATSQAHEQLKNFWELEGKPDNDYLGWANNKSKVNITSLNKSLSKIKTLLEKINSCIENRDSLTIAEAEFKIAENNHKEAENSFKAEQDRMSGHEKHVIDVLKEAKSFLNIYSTDKCPVCESKVDIEQLKIRIEERLTELANLVKLKKTLDDAKEQLEAKGQILDSKKKEFISKVHNLTTIVKTSSFTEITLLGIDWTKYSALLTSDNISLIDSAKALLDNILTCKSSLVAKQQQEQKIVNQFTSIKSNLQTLTEKTTQARKLESQLAKLNKILELVEIERKTFVENELGSISGKIDNLYSKIHPNEGLGNIKLFLKPNVSSSLEFIGQFQDKSDISPQAYYSESHLDTLGVCIFLALSKKYSDDGTVVILDDVITSVDQAHMTRFMQALHDEASNFNQLIITTHYRPWRDRYKYSQGPTANVHLIDLLHWSHPRGIRHTKTKHSVEELIDHLKKDELDRQSVASKAGILLEGLIDHIALIYNCKLPRKAEPNYTLGELLDSISKKLKSALIMEKLNENSERAEIVLSGLIDEVSGLTWIRNQVGCHFNVLGMEISDADVRQYGELTIKFANALICNKCGELPCRNKSGSYWECKCGSAFMHPFTIPS